MRRRRLCAVLAAIGVGCAPRSVARPPSYAPPAAVAPAARATRLALDTDRDCIPNHREDRDGDGVVDPGETDPLRADSDRDGLHDGFEDRNCNGRQDGAETSATRRDSDRDGVGDGVEVAVTRTDPMRANTDAELRAATRTLAGRHDAVQVPEPMIFDLARSLGARRGELEVNTLMVLERRDGQNAVRWAPEVEWAFARGHTIELELPFHGSHLEALKFALQGTIGTFGGNRFIHGWQSLNEVTLADSRIANTLLYLFGTRFTDRFSAFAMTGARADWTPGQSDREFSFVANASAFADLSNRLVVGLEANTVYSSERWRVAVVPQVHASLVHWLRLQVGVGVEASDTGVGGVAAARLIVER
ncbi:MAG: hypothetical protein Q7V43_38530 [Myxococcales bacterium]|nr:hypothetical protein [Myxococcales bacterium]